MQSYIIRKSPGTNQEYQIVARIHVDDEGKVLFELMVDDIDVARVIVEAQTAGGLFCQVSFGEEKNGVIVTGMRETFVKTTDADFMEALESNIQGGLVDRD